MGVDLPGLGPGGGSRDYLRAALTVCCVASLTLSAVLLPAVIGDGVASVNGLGVGSGRDLQTSGGGAHGGPTAPGGASGGTGGEDGGGTTGGAPGDGPPGDGDADGQGAESSPGGASGGSGGLGALNPGSRTQTGGPVSEALRGQSTLTHFVVVSERPAYWRTGAYDAYTGDGWRRSPRASQSERYDGPIDVGGRRDPTFVQEVTLERSGTSLPVAWRPRVVGDGIADRVRVTDQRGLRLSEPAEPGTTYRVGSVPQVRDPSLLRQLPGQYPARVERRYTQLPSGTPDRVGSRTDQIVAEAGAENPYAVATAIERWLEANREYSLDASATDERIADRFLFEMDAGYCEYFATTMTVMLRTQDVPARYVVGYSTGEPVGEDTYVVRGMNAHAWVEVYFPSVGWVRFDPTPGSQRISAESSAMGGSGGTGGGGGSGTGGQSGSSADGSSYDHVETGSPGESFDSRGPASGSGEGTGGSGGGDGGTAGEGGGTTGSDGQSEDGSSGDGSQTGDRDSTGSRDGGDSDRGGEQGTSDGESDAGQREESGDDAQSGDSTDSTSSPDEEAPLEAEIVEEPVPGRTVTVSVTRGGAPVEGVTVSFNGDPVGRTDERGEVSARVPYTATLEVTVAEGTAGDLGVLPLLATERAGPPRAAYDVDVPGGLLPALGATGVRAGNETVYRLPTDVSIEHDGEVVPGRATTLTAEIEGVPVAGGRVVVDGREVGTTSENGTFDLPVPFEENVSVAVTRGEATGNTTLEPVTEVRVNLTAPVPGREATVTATLAGEPLPEARVFAADGLVGATGPEGAASFRVPYADPLTVSAERGAATGSTTVDVPNVTIETAPGILPMSTAGFPVTVTARLDGEPVPDAVVAVNGETATRTGPDGTATTTLPFANVVELSVTRGSMGASESLSWLLVPYLVALLGVVAVAVGARRARRSDRSARDVLATMAALGRRVPARAVELLVLLAGRGDRAITRGVEALRRAVARLVAELRRLRRSLPPLAALLARVPSMKELLGFLSSPESVLARLRGALWSLLARLRAAGASEATPEPTSAPGVADRGAVGTPGEDLEETRLTVREAWFELVDRLGVAGYETKTPGEIAGIAERRGLDMAPVGDLVDAFREVEYGSRGSATAQRERAERAIERVRAQLDAEGTGRSSAGGTT